MIKSQGRSEKNQGSRGRGNRKQGRQQNDTYSGFSLGISDLQARELARGGSYTGYQALPPGIAKNVAQGKPLPPGIAKKSVPADMMPGLPVHPGYQWQVLGRDLVLVQDGSNVIADILRDVFR